MTEHLPGPIEAGILADLERGKAQGAFDTALAALAVRLARECDAAPTASLAQRLRETLVTLAENRQTEDAAEMEAFIAELSRPV